MTQINDHDNERLLDRLVDGELADDERRELLAALDDPQGVWRDQGWRRCALAFLESQAWEHQCKQIVAEPARPQQEPPSLASLPAPLAAPLERPRVGRWLAVAASLLFAFSLGWLTNRSAGIQTQTNNFAANKLKSGEGQEILKHDELHGGVLKEGGPEDVVTLLVRDASGKNQRLQVPLMEAGGLENQLSLALPTELRAKFRDRGFDVQRRRRFAPMFFEQDKQLVPMIVPVDDTYVVPVSRPVF